MRYHTIISICLLLMGALAESKAVDADAEPFSKLEEAVKAQWGGWSGDKRVLAPLFNGERDRLGSDFQNKLLEYLDGNVDRHYWAASFLTKKAYLAGRPALKELALLILHQAIILCNESKDGQSQPKLLPTLVNSAILSQELGLSIQAESHKREVNRLIKENADLAGSWPALSEEDRALYESIRIQLPDDKT